nr:MAG TPA: hypothetical protein [Caudoviricetes sp.]
MQSLKLQNAILSICEIPFFANGILPLYSCKITVFVC